MGCESGRSDIAALQAGTVQALAGRHGRPGRAPEHLPDLSLLQGLAIHQASSGRAAHSTKASHQQISITCSPGKMHPFFSLFRHKLGKEQCPLLVPQFIHTVSVRFVYPPRRQVAARPIPRSIARPRQSVDTDRITRENCTVPPSNHSAMWLCACASQQSKIRVSGSHAGAYKTEHGAPLAGPVNQSVIQSLPEPTSKCV